ncbi:MAG TPA: TonB-dependent receptor [Sphingomonadaceae bacterium]|nr:TonB-dependent receptor [Sphingomonadaceae bacterium]
MTGITKTSRLACTSLLALLATIGFGNAALAQDGAAPAANEVPEDIIVTGSRIARSGFTTPTPVTVVGADRLETLAATNVGDVLNQVPAFRATSSPTTAGVTVGAGGARTVDLRGLGAPRTLVLVDGRRFVPSTAQGTVDTNLIPSILIDRVEVVTGGASAAYGSDAVAGVVNFILDKKLEGVKGSVQQGISQRGDDRETMFSLAGGTSFAGGRGHIVIGGEYDDAKGVGGCKTRSFCAGEWQVLTNSTPGVNGYPAFYLTNDVHTALLTQGGLINSGPLRGTQFLADGTPAPFEYGILPGLFMGGGSGHGQNPFRTAGVIKVPVERHNIYGRAQYEFGSTTAYVEGSYGRVHVITPASQIRDTGIIIQRDNPYLPDSIRDQLPVGGSVKIGRAGDDLGFAIGDTKVETYRAVAGLEGKLGSRWSWDAYYQYGQTNFDQTVTNNRINANFTRAVNAVVDPVTGDTVCADTLSPDPAIRAAAAGCHPLNIIGQNQFTPEAKAYAYGTSQQNTRLTQHVVAANLRGDLLDLWAGPLSVAAGFEYRRDQISGTSDPISQANGFYITNAVAFSPPAVKVTEGYLEAVLPLLRDAPFARSLELNGAVRRTHYSTSGSVTTWKIGGVYEPIEAVRFRATRSRDIRAPNVNELFLPLTTSFSSVLDKATGDNPLVPILRGGNPALKPEIADTTTVGVILSPRGFLQGLRLAVDYYDIKIDNAINTLGAQTIANNCYEGMTQFCAQIERGADGKLVRITDSFLNVDQLKTRGIDFELDYRVPVSAKDVLTFRALATYVDKLELGSVDRAGMTGIPVSGTPGIPDWTVDTTITWDHDPFALTLQGHYISAGKYDVTLIGPDDPRYNVSLPNSINDNRVPSYLLFNLSGRVNIINEGGRQFQIFGAVNNLFDRKPPLAPGSTGYTNAILFDQVGRTFRVGARFKY